MPNVSEDRLKRLETACHRVSNMIREFETIVDFQTFEELVDAIDAVADPACDDHSSKFYWRARALDAEGRIANALA